MWAWNELVGPAVALGVGLLVGVAREHNNRKAETVAPGMRAFVFVALAGAIAGLLVGVGIAVTGGLVVIAALEIHRRTRTRNPALTSEVAVLAVFLLGVLSTVAPVLAAVLGSVIALLLAAKAWQHGFARRVFSADGFHEALLLTATTAILLPLLPDHTIDPWQVLNPRKLWLLAVLVMAISSIGHVALRSFGARAGLLLAGFAGGFVSSTATIASMGSRARDMPPLASTCAGAGVLSNVGTVIQLAVVAGALSPPLLRQIALPLLASGTVAVGFSLLAGWRTRHLPIADVNQRMGRAFNPGQVLGFIAIVAAVLLLSGMAMSWLGDAALIWTLAASGLADVHAAAASAAQLVALDRLGEHEAAMAVLYAFAANSTSKLAVAFSTGGLAYGLRLLPGIVLMLAAFAAVMLLY